MRQGPELHFLPAPSFQSLFRSLRFLYPQSSDEQLMDHIHTLQAANATTPSTNHIENQPIREETYSGYGGDTQPTPRQSLRASPVPLGHLTPAPIPREANLSPSVNVSSPAPVGPSTSVRQRIEQTAVVTSSFRDQVSSLQSMFPHLSREEILNLIWPDQKGKTLLASSSRIETLRANQRNTYPVHEENIPSTPILSPRPTPIPLDLLTLLPMSRKVNLSTPATVIPPVPRDLPPVRIPPPASTQFMAPQPSAPFEPNPTESEMSLL